AEPHAEHREPEPHVEAREEHVEESPAKVDDVARAALERADRDRGKRKTRSAPTAETKEFWETWAENKSTREPEPEPAPAAEERKTERSERAERSERGGRDRGRDRDKRGRGERSAERREHKDDKPARGKRDTVVEAPAAAADGNQARLFVSLGKKHGVSADDLRNLLAGPIGGDTSRIGSVSLRDSHAHVRVPEELVDTIIAGVHGTSHNEHNVTVERARA
ncbi:MAG TPA: DbpA RNA binding domain-containing protein, partial [Kofleriaceae bacterium]|nr:DbpA RNA binding domain-containing protein [Kofleriaceae bacterium]